MTITAAKPPSRAAFVFIFVTVMLDMLALGVTVPVLPKLITQFEGGNYGDAAQIIGYFGFAWAAMQFVCSPIIGGLSDRFGRRPIIILSNLGLGFDYLILALAPSVGWLLLGRLVSGVTAATFSTASAYIADVTAPEQRAAKFGMLGAAFGLGFVIGPAIGGVLGQIDLRLPFWVSAGFSLLNGVYGYFVLPESLAMENRSKFDWSKANPMGSLRLLMSQPILIGLAAATFLQRIAHDGLPSLLVIYTDYRYGWTAQTVGLVLAAIGISSMIVAAGLTGPLVKRFGERKVMTAGLILGAIGFAIYGTATTGNAFIVGVPLLALWGLSGPTMQSLMSQRVGPSAQGQLQGALASLTGVAGMIGPLLVTQTFAAGVRGVGAFHLPGAPYMLGAVMVAGAMVLALRASRPQTTTA